VTKRIGTCQPSAIFAAGLDPAAAVPYFRPMARPDPALLDTARYPFSRPIEPRFGDLDVNGHINNVAIAGLFEDTRIRFARANGFHASVHGLATMIASLAIEYLGEGYYPDTLVVHNAVERLGRTSHSVIQLIVQGATTVAFARTVIVAVGDAGPATLSDDFVRDAGQWMLRP
jgi:acyl-CoA thioester hydrolase